MTCVRTNERTQAPSTTAEQLDAEGLELISRGYAKCAEAAKLRATTTTEAGDWIRVDAIPGSKRAALAAARGGQLRAVKRGRVWLATRADVAAWLASKAPATAVNDDGDEETRALLGLAMRRA